jgi:hypothetical protein
MGFLDKAMKAATLAREQIGEVREVHALARHRPEPAPAALDDHEVGVVERALALGAPPPTALLTAEEASEIAGVPLGGPHLVYGDDTIGVRFTATGPRQQRWSVEVQAFHASGDDTRFDAREHWHGFVAEHVAGNGGTPVGDLGDAALARDGEVFVLAGPLVFFATVTPATGSAQAVATARRVLARLDG